MAQIIIPRKAPIIDPPSGVPILNRNSPQAPGLDIWLSAFHPGSPRDLVSGYVATNTGLDLAVSTWGKAWRHLDDGDELDLAGQYSLGDEWTAVLITKPTTINAANAGFFRTNSTATGDTFVIFSASNGPGDPFVRAGGTTLTGIDGSTDPGISTNIDQVLIAAVRSGDSAFYINGIKTHTSTTTFTAPTGTDAEIHNLFWQFNTSQTLEGFHYEVRFYNYRIPDSLAYEIGTIPRDLYWRPRKLVVVSVGAAEGAEDQNIAGSLLEDSDTLNHGKISIDIAGSLLEDSDALYHGEITTGSVDIQGSALEDADVLYHGLISKNIAGTILEDTDELYHGEIDTGTVDIAGSALTDADELYHGKISVDIEGSVLEDADTLHHGAIAVGIANIAGSILEDADQLNHGLITLSIEGSALEDADVLNHGKLDLGLLGSLLEDADNLYHGQIGVEGAVISGSLHQDADDLYHGEIDVGTFNVQGSILEDADTLYHGLISPQNLFGSLLEDADTLNHGLITPGVADIAGTLLEEDNQLFHGVMNFSIIEGSLFADEDILYHGLLIYDILGSIFEEEDGLFHGKIAGGVRPQIPRIVATGLANKVRGYDTVDPGFPDTGI